MPPTSRGRQRCACSKEREARTHNVLQEVTAPGSLTEGKMSVRAIVSIASISGLLVTAALAQQPAQTAAGVKLPACSQSMIVGTWQAVLAPSFRDFACP